MKRELWPYTIIILSGIILGFARWKISPLYFEDNLWLVLTSTVYTGSLFFLCGSLYSFLRPKSSQSNSIIYPIITISIVYFIAFILVTWLSPFVWLYELSDSWFGVILALGYIVLLILFQKKFPPLPDRSWVALVLAVCLFLSMKAFDKWYFKTKHTYPYDIVKIFNLKTDYFRELLLFGSFSFTPQDIKAQLPDNLSDRNIIILIYDALRVDKLGCYGFDRPTSPNIDSFCNDPSSVRFDQHFVQGNWTKPSTASLFTGLWGRHHGVSINYDKLVEGKYITNVLNEGFDTLAEQLKQNGYQTMGSVTVTHLDSKYGFAKGFDTYFSPGKGWKGDKGGLAQFFIWLKNVRPKKFFSYLHLCATHFPYQATPKNNNYMKTYSIDYDLEGALARKVDFTGPEVNYLIKDGLKLNSKDVNYLHLLYEAKLHRYDIFFGSFIRELKEAGVYDKTLIILTSDHGEELYDHQSYGHNQSLYNELLHVPLIVKFPKDAKPANLSQVYSGYSCSIDIFPSILAYLNHPIPKILSSGINYKLFNGQTRNYVYSEMSDGETLIRDGYKYIHIKGQETLFDLTKDPLEKNNLIISAKKIGAQMASFIESEITSKPGPKFKSKIIKEKLSTSATKNLRALGYLQ